MMTSPVDLCLLENRCLALVADLHTLTSLNKISRDKDEKRPLTSFKSEKKIAVMFSLNVQTSEIFSDFKYSSKYLWEY